MQLHVSENIVAVNIQNEPGFIILPSTVTSDKMLHLKRFFKLYTETIKQVSGSTLKI